jgi:hypothetical protein
MTGVIACHRDDRWAKARKPDVTEKMRKGVCRCFFGTTQWPVRQRFSATSGAALLG